MTDFKLKIYEQEAFILKLNWGNRFIANINETQNKEYMKVIVH